MKEHEFEFGPLSRGAYIALISIVPLVPFVARPWFIHYLLFLVLLGFGARPVLERTGLYRMWTSIEASLLERWDSKYLEKRRAQIDRKVRDDKYRKSRVRDPSLPKRW